MLFVVMTAMIFSWYYGLSITTRNIRHLDFTPNTPAAATLSLSVARSCLVLIDDDRTN